MEALRFELRPSRALAGGLALVHVAGAAALVIALPVQAGLPAALLLLALGAAAVWSRAWLRAAGSVRAIELSDGGMATFEQGDGRRVSGLVRGGRHVGRIWVSLPFPGGPRRTVLVVRDMLEPRAYRWLRLWALWGRLPQRARAGYAD